MNNLNKRMEFNREITKMFLGNKDAEVGPVRSDIFKLLHKYNVYFLEYEKVQIEERALFLVQYLMHCRHCVRPIDRELVEKLVNQCILY